MTAGASSGRPRGPWIAALVVLLALLAGGVAGVALDRLVLLPGRAWRPDGEHGPGRRPPRDREFRTRFAREVGLTPEQRQRVDSIMERQWRELRAVRRQVQPQLDSIIGSTRRALDSVLTPEQRKKAEQIRRRHPRPPGPPPGAQGPGRPDEPPPGPPPD